MAAESGNKSRFKIRRVFPEDIPQMEQIDTQAFPTMTPQPDYRRELKNKLAHYIVACGEKEGKEYIAGFSGLWMLVNEGHIVNLVVREGHRRKGIGELLLMHIIKLAIDKGAQLVTLEVRDSNKTAQSLYKKYGFEVMGIRRGYYLDNREDAVIMTVEDTASDVFNKNMKKLEAEYCRKRGFSTGIF